MNKSTTTSQPFPFLNLPQELRLMVYEYLITHSSIFTVADSSHTVTLVSQDLVPPVHWTCKSLYSQDGAFLRRLSRSMILPRVVFHVNNDLDLRVYRSLVDTLLYLLHMTRRQRIKGSNMPDFQASLREYVRMLFRVDPNIIDPKWIQKNFAAVMRWSLRPSEYFVNSKISSGLVMEIALSGPFVNDSSLSRLLQSIDNHLGTGDLVRVYEIARKADLPSRDERQRVAAEPRSHVDYGGVIDDEMWDKEWA